MEQSNSFPPPLFDIRELAEGVYAALPGKNSPLFSNAGIIDLGERTLVFDTFNTLQGGTALLAAALALTGRPPALVIISHCHGDHWMGTQAFGTAPQPHAGRWKKKPCPPRLRSKNRSTIWKNG